MFTDSVSTGERVQIGISSPIDDLLRDKSGINLDIGCGANKQTGFVGIDIRPLPGVDIVWDITKFPWPLPDNCVNNAMASHLVEHIPPHNFGFVNFMNEVWRVLKPDGKFMIATPHGRSSGYIQDPTHCNPCNEATFAYFAPHHESGLWNIYQPKPYVIEYITWNPAANIEVILRKMVFEDE